MHAPRRGRISPRSSPKKGWYHSFELPDGTTIEGYNKIGWLHKRYNASRSPPTSTASACSISAPGTAGSASRPSVTAPPSPQSIAIEVPNFLDIHRRLSSKVDYRICDFYELPEAGLGTFDFVFCLGILYHLKHPLLALEIVCALTTDTAIVESFVIDADTGRTIRTTCP